jgi:outer membrane receptor protein involved in Fe transport
MKEIPRMPSLLRLALLPATLAAAFPVYAQQAEASTVQVQGKAYDARRDDTAARIVVRHEDIIRYGDTNLLDVLKRLPGVTVSGSAGRGGEIRMQGLGSGYTQVLVDGQQPPQGMDPGTLAPDTIERIEILRVASAEVSNQAIAGTINIVLHKVLNKAPRKPERGIKIGYAAGHDTRSPSLDLNLADRGERSQYSLAGSLVHDHFRDDVPSREEALDAAGRQLLSRTTAGHEDGSMTTLNLAPQFGWKLDGGDSLELENLLNLNRFKVDVDAPTTTLLGAPPPYPGTRIRMRNENDALTSQLHWMHGLAIGASLDVKFGVGLGRTDNTSDRDAGGNPAVGQLAETIASRGRDHGLRSTGKLTIPLGDAQHETHALALGWDASVDWRSDERHERDVLPASASAVIDAQRYTGRIARLAAYAQDEWQLTPRLSAYLGARWEGVRIHAEGSDFGSTGSRSDVFSPVLQTLYKLGDDKGPAHDQLRFAISRTYKAPSMDQLLPHRFTSVNNNQVEPDTLGNPNLKPELALGLDAAWEHSWAEGTLFSLSASTRRIDDYTRYLVRFDGGRWISQPANVGKARTRTVQLETQFPLPTVFDSAPPLEMRANLARNWSRVDAVPGPDNRLDQQTPLSANLGFDYHANRWTGGANFGFQRGAKVAVASNQAAYLSARRDLELYALYKLDPLRQLRISALNVLGQDMVNERSYVDPASGTVLRNRTVNVGNPSVRMTLESKF